MALVVGGVTHYPIKARRRLEQAWGASAIAVARCHCIHCRRRRCRRRRRRRRRHRRCRRRRLRLHLCRRRRRRRRCCPRCHLRRLRRLHRSHCHRPSHLRCPGCRQREVGEGDDVGDVAKEGRN